MERTAKLTYTSNPALQEFIGLTGALSRNEQGGYSFKMFENGKTIRTSMPKPNTTLGDVDYPACRNIGFETKSGSIYQFDFMDIERVVDGTRRVDNRFLGFEDTFKVKDSVVTGDGYKGIITDYNQETGIFLVARNDGAVAPYRVNEIRHFGINDMLNEMQQRAEAMNDNHQENVKKSVDMGLG